MLTQLIEDYQDNESENAKAALRKWNAERDQLRYETIIILLESELKRTKSIFWTILGKPPNVCLINNLAASSEHTTIQHTSRDVCFDFRTFTPATFRI